MYKQVEKLKENKSRAVANSATQKKNNGEQGFGFVDNRLKKEEPIQLVYNPRTYIQNPNYHLRTQPRGGENSTVTLGAGAFALQGNGTNADRNRPGGMRRARRQFPAESFKAGHILNAEFGGSGTDNANLMILTAAGNAAHRAFDQPVKHAIHYLYNILQIMYGIHGNIVNGYNCGIEIQVIVDNIYWREVYTNAGFANNAQRNAANNIPYNFQGYAQYQDGGTNLYNMITAIGNLGTRQTALNHWNSMNQQLATANNVGIIVNPYS